MAKLSQQNIVNLKKDYDSKKYTNEQLAKKYNVKKTAILFHAAGVRNFLNTRITEEKINNFIDDYKSNNFTVKELSVKYGMSNSLAHYYLRRNKMKKNTIKTHNNTATTATRLQNIRNQILSFEHKIVLLKETEIELKKMLITEEEQYLKNIHQEMELRTIEVNKMKEELSKLDDKPLTSSSTHGSPDVKDLTLNTSSNGMLDIPNHNHTSVGT